MEFELRGAHGNDESICGFLNRARSILNATAEDRIPRTNTQRDADLEIQDSSRMDPTLIYILKGD